MAITYTTIASTTLGSDNSTIQISSIPQTYSDIRLVFSVSSTLGGTIRAQINSDTSSGLYGQQIITINGTNKLTYRTGALNYWEINRALGVSTDVQIPSTGWIDFLDYRGSVRKTGLWHFNRDYQDLERAVGCWLTTSAINTVSLTISTGSFLAGSRVTLYGILRA